MAETQPTTEATVTHVPEANRYEIHVEGTRIGLADYRLRDGRHHLTHTEIDPRWGGRGYGAELVRGMLDGIGEDGGTVVPICSFVVDFIDRNPEYRGLVAR